MSHRTTITPLRGRLALLIISGLLAGAAVPSTAAAAGSESDAPRLYTCGHLGMSCPDESRERTRKQRRAARARAEQARRAKRARKSRST